MQDRTSDITFRPQSPRSARREDAAWESVVREELLKLRRRTPRASRVVPFSRPPQNRTGPGAPPPPAG
jgi:hypothetical protein